MNIGLSNITGSVLKPVVSVFSWLKPEGDALYIKDIELWKESINEIKHIYGRSMEAEHPKDKGFNRMLGEGLVDLNRFNNKLVSKLRKIRLGAKATRESETCRKRVCSVPCKQKPTRDSCEGYAATEMIRYTKFNFNLVVSRVRYYFFREEQNASLNFPNNTIIEEIYYIAYAIVKNLNEILDSTSNNFEYDDSEIDNSKVVSLFKKKKNHLSRLLTEYFFYVSLFYNFVYDEVERTGFFKHYKYDINLYKSSKDIILRNIKKCYGQQGTILAGVNECWKSIDIGSLNHIVKYDKENHLTISRDFYRKVVNKYRSSASYFEPKTERLNLFIWKIASMVFHSDPLVMGFDTESALKSTVGEKIKQFIETYYQLCDKFYEKKKTDFHAIYLLENDLVSYLYENVVHRRKTSLQLNENSEKLSEVALQNTENVLNLSIEIDENDKDILGNIISRLEAKTRYYLDFDKSLKFEKLFDLLDYKDLLLLLTAYASFSDLIIEKQHAKTPAIVGYYRAGAFFAHFYNAYRRTINKDMLRVFFFRTFPYINTHPLHDDNDKCLIDNERVKNGIDSIFCFDESIKTGFTQSMYTSFLERHCFGEYVPSTLFSLFRFKSYAKLENLVDSSFSLVNVHDDGLSSRRIENNVNVKIPKKGFTFAVPKIHDLKRVFEHANYTECIKINNSDTEVKRFDSSIVLTDTISYFNVVDYFYKKILSKLEELSSAKVLLFSPSREGHTVMLGVALLLKKDNIDVSLSHDENDRVRCALDIVKDDVSLLIKWSSFKNDTFDLSSIGSEFGIRVNLLERDSHGELAFLEEQTV